MTSFDEKQGFVQSRRKLVDKKDAGEVWESVAHKTDVSREVRWHD